MHPELCDRHRHLTAKHFHHPPQQIPFPLHLSQLPAATFSEGVPTLGIAHKWNIPRGLLRLAPLCRCLQGSASLWHLSELPFYGRIIHLIGFLKLSFQRSFSQASVWQKDLAEEGQFEHSFQFTREPRLPPRRGARSDELLSKHFDSYLPSTLTVRFSYQLEETQKDILTRKKRKSEPARSRT